MLRKLMVYSLAVAALGCLALGCSEDINRVTSPESVSPTTTLSTSDEWPSSQTLEDYISQGFYYPDDTTVTDDQAPVDQDNPMDRFNGDGGSDKPIDNSLDGE